MSSLTAPDLSSVPSYRDEAGNPHLDPKCPDVAGSITDCTNGVAYGFPCHLGHARLDPFASLADLQDLHQKFHEEGPCVPSPSAVL